MKDLKKYKWRIYWGVFVLLTVLLILIAIFFEERIWIGNAIQTLGTIVGLYATILIFTQSKEESNLQFQEHLKYLQDLNTQEIEVLQRSTQKQIEALQKSTFDQISAFEKQTNEITEKLSENSILLAEILGRELEKAISQTTSLLEKEERQLNDLKGFKLLRTEQEKKIQLANKQNRLFFIKKWIDRWTTKYNRLMSYFGFNQKFSNENE